MSWLGIVLVVLGLYLAFKLVGAALKLLMWVLVLLGAYWFLAPRMGWPTLSELVYVLGPDFGGRRIEEVMQPAEIAGEVTERVVGGVIERIESARPAADARRPSVDPSPPGPLPEAAAADADAAAAREEPARPPPAR